MSKSRLKFEIEDIKRLYTKAVGHNLYYDEINEETRKIEAFLIQSALLEGVLCELVSQIAENKVPVIYKKRNDKYNLNNAIDDLYLLKIITEKEFTALDDFRKTRNKYFHGLLKEDPGKLEKQLGDEYSNFEEITWKMIERLEEIY
jgi:hypothetical protein